MKRMWMMRGVPVAMRLCTSSANVPSCSAVLIYMRAISIEPGSSKLSHQLSCAGTWPGRPKKWKKNFNENQYNADGMYMHSIGNVLDVFHGQLNSKESPCQYWSHIQRDSWKASVCTGRESHEKCEPMRTVTMLPMSPAEERLKCATKTLWHRSCAVLWRCWRLTPPGARQWVHRTEDL